MLPVAFLERMKRLLGEEYGSFLSALSEPGVRAIRINSIKCNDGAECLGLPTDEKIPYHESAYVALPSPGLGNSPYHHAGAFYIQDPGAMVSAEAVDVEEGWHILDLCAAPGGKTTQLAAKLGEGGFILSNEIVPKRAKILVSNIERLGITNATVTSLDTAELARLYSDYFDLVVADAPCSGEGMFRKGEVAREEWSPEGVLSCAKRQLEILGNAKSLVKRGGYIIYSTCTYSVEENEAVVDKFLEENRDFELCPLTDRVRAVTVPGIQPKGAFSEKLSLTGRFYPYRARGEGQFVALLRRLSGGAPRELYKTREARLTPEESSAIERFFDECLTATPVGRLCKSGDNIVIIPHSLPTPPHSVFMSGVLVGTLKGKTLVPSHQFFSAFGKLFKVRENIEEESVAKKYLAGEEIDTSTENSGFIAVFYKGIPLGGGKAVLGKIKNHYPKGLRI